MSLGRAAVAKVLMEVSFCFRILSGSLARVI